MSTLAQVTANQVNAQHSTGPRTSEGKAASARNHLSHGLSGSQFTVLDWEDQHAFDELLQSLDLEHQPATPTEQILVRKLAEHYWLTQRAITLQNSCFQPEIAPDDPEKQLALYLRYQTTHDRAFHKSLAQLLKLRAEKRKAEIGFESQQRKLAQQEERARRRQAYEERQAADHARREAAEKRKQDMHHWDLLFRQAEMDHQISKTNMLQMDRIAAELRAEEAAERPIRPQKAA
ncbi:MAG: hypothetical protein JOY62_00250 [Acidobacteriaceae bacterium]|nr:hypothetical protein [Acidobacteriaceae bacterium]MBV9778374.1 hypothetical protein [Acidobacteriaceae bacterium]